jgi:hypothetical protein
MKGLPASAGDKRSQKFASGKEKKKIEKKMRKEDVQQSGQ